MALLRSPQARAPKTRRWLLAAAALAALVCAAGCSSLTYYGQAAWGQTRILLKRRDIAKLIADPDTPAALRRRLAAVQGIRDFAVAELALPDGGSYRSFVQLPPRADGSPRRAVVWNVVAAPELDLTPKIWCFPVAGCVSYRGYFSEARARRFAERLRRDGWDVDVAGAAAYSTLGWFADPLLSTVIDAGDVYLAGLLFHELAHQLVYVKDDSRFNESFATAVEVAGLERWSRATGRPAAEMDRYREGQRREAAFVDLVLATRDRLREVYAGDAPAAERRRRKKELFAELEAAYRDLRAAWGDEPPSWDRWFERELNNARLVSVATYHDLVPAFQALLAREQGDLPAFYAAVRELAALAPEQRRARLAALAPAAD